MPVLFLSYALLNIAVLLCLSFACLMPVLLCLSYYACLIMPVLLCLSYNSAIMPVLGLYYYARLMAINTLSRHSMSKITNFYWLMSLNLHALGKPPPLVLT